MDRVLTMVFKLKNRVLRKKTIRIVVSVVFVLCFCGSLFFYTKEKSVTVDRNQEAFILDWNVLNKLGADGPDSEQMLQLHEKRVRIAGFFVPLVDDFQRLNEFLLVPNAQACIHVPAPPPYLMIYVKLAKEIKLEEMTNPVWVDGVLFVESKASFYGKSAYLIRGAVVEGFSWETEG